MVRDRHRPGDLPWGWWLRVRDGVLEDEDGRTWRSVRDAFWQGELNFPDVHFAPEQHELLLRALSALDSPCSDANESRHDLFSGDMLFWRFYQCCSMAQVDWRGRGFDGKALGYLLVQNGFYFCGHRAANDVDAMIEMLRHRDGGGRTALAEMIERGSASSWVVRASGAHFDLKDALRARGYRWSADLKVWAKEVADDDLVPEQLWLAANVYSADAKAKALCPELVRVTPRTRFL